MYMLHNVAHAKPTQKWRVLLILFYAIHYIHIVYMWTNIPIQTNHMISGDHICTYIHVYMYTCTCRLINNSFKFAQHQCVYSTAYTVLSECLWKNFTGDSGGIRTHNLLLTRGDVWTSQPPSLPDDDWPARIPYIVAGSAIFIGWWNSCVGWQTIDLILFDVCIALYTQCRGL